VVGTRRTRSRPLRRKRHPQLLSTGPVVVITVTIFVISTTTSIAAGDASIGFGHLTRQSDPRSPPRGEPALHLLRKPTRPKQSEKRPSKPLGCGSRHGVALPVEGGEQARFLARRALAAEG
jgi:hypothetical protein